MSILLYGHQVHKVCVIGDFNHWQNDHELFVRWDSSGIWEGFVPGLTAGDLYKYRIFSNHDNGVTEKCDPFARACEKPPKTASIVVPENNYKWKDNNWMSYRKDKNDLDKPYAVYEVPFVLEEKPRESYADL